MNELTVFENPVLREKYYRFFHKSGLPIYVFPKSHSTTCAFFGTRYGSVDNCFRLAGETEYTTVPDGIAHYLEHRMFTQKDGSDVTERFSAMGADSNAFTTYAKTVYMCTCTERADEAIEALLDFVTQPHFTEELVEKERGIIIQEILMGEDNPYNRCFDLLMEAMYHACSVRNNVAGSVASVSQITAEMLNRCYDVFYTPTNMALVVCGDVTPEAVAAAADRAIPGSFKAKEVERFYCEEPESVKEAYTEAQMVVAKPLFSIGIKDPHLMANGEDRMRRYAVMSVLCDVIFCRSGKLYNMLFEEGLISPDFSFYYTCSDLFAYTAISGEADSPEEVLQRIKAYIAELAENGLSKADFERSRRVLYAEYVKNFDATEEIAYDMMDFIFDGADLLNFGSKVLDVTLEQANELLRSAFLDQYFSLAVIRPKRKENL